MSSCLDSVLCSSEPMMGCSEMWNNAVRVWATGGNVWCVAEGGCVLYVVSKGPSVAMVVRC